MRRSELAGRWVWYLAVFALAFVTVALIVRPWSLPESFTFPAGNDWVWQQATFQMHAQVGFWGTTDHVAWPIGSNPWRLPQMGGLIGMFAWFTVGILGMGTASAVWWALSLAAGLNAVALLYFFRSYSTTGTQLLAAVFAVVLGSSLFVLSAQLNLSFLYAIPLAFALIARWPKYSRTGRAVALGVGLLAFALSPLWWVVVLALLLPFVALSWFLRGDWRGGLPTVGVWIAVAVALGVQALLFTLAAAGGPGDDTTRSRWTANFLSGRAVDLAASIPLLKRLDPNLHSRLLEGSSYFDGLGVLGALTALVALLVLLALPGRRLRSGLDVTLLSAATLMVTLYWLSGGLGNLQAALFAALDSTSPARAFSRMVIPLGILGAAWLIVLLNENVRRQGRMSRLLKSRWLVIAVGVSAFLAWSADIVDLQWRRTNDQVALSLANSRTQTDTAAVNFLTRSKEPCPVAQVPNEAIPASRVERLIVDPDLYRGYVPYVLAPDFFWSAGSHWAENPQGLSLLPRTFTDSDVDALRSLGFCAVLFDKELSAVAIEQGAELEGTEIDFSTPPDYEDDYFEIYLLDEPSAQL